MHATFKQRPFRDDLVRKVAISCLRLLISKANDGEQRAVVALWKDVIAEALVVSTVALEERKEVYQECVFMIGDCAQHMPSDLVHYLDGFFYNLIRIHEICSQGPKRLRKEAVLSILKLCPACLDTFRREWKRWIPLVLKEASRLLNNETMLKFLRGKFVQALASCWPLGAPMEVAQLVADSFNIIPADPAHSEQLMGFLAALVEDLGPNAVLLFMAPQGVAATVCADAMRSPDRRVRSGAWKMWVRILQRCPSHNIVYALAPLDEHCNEPEAFQCFTDYWAVLSQVEVNDDLFERLEPLLRRFLGVFSHQKPVWDMLLRCTSMKFFPTHMSKFCAFWAHALHRLCWAFGSHQDALGFAIKLGTWLLAPLREDGSILWKALHENARGLASAPPPKCAGRV